MSDRIERVTKAVRKAREMSLCSLCDGPYGARIRCTCREIAEAAIEAMREPTGPKERALAESKRLKRIVKPHPRRAPPTLPTKD